MQNKFKKAFTLIELLIVIAIIAILTVAFLPGALKAPAKARDAGKVKKVQDIVAAVEAYNAQKASYPTDTTITNNTCFTKNIADDVGMELPIDSTKLGSCSNTDMDKFLYIGGSNFYVVGVRVEIDSAANTYLSSPITAPTNLADAKALVGVDKADNKRPYYLSVGP